jgi:glycosyltransferase 2 family protein
MMEQSRGSSVRFGRAGIGKLLTVVATLLSIGWVTLLLKDAWPEIAARRSGLDAGSLGVGLALAMVSAWFLFEAFAVLARVVGISAVSRLQLAHLHFTGQLFKHLPGRVWGIGYQWAAGVSAGSLRDWVFANVAHLGLATYVALWSALLVLAVDVGIASALAVAVAGVVVYWLGWRLVSWRALQGGAARFPGRTGALVVGSMHLLASVSRTDRYRLLAWSCAGSLAFYAAWWAYGAAYDPLGASGGMRLGAFYMVAWFVGYVSLLTPSGLGVRELVFAWLAQEYSPDVIALMAIVGRVGLLAVDLLLGLLFAPFAPHRPPLA